MRLIYYIKDMCKKEVDLLINKANEPYKTMFQIMAYMGLRIGEVVRIHSNDLNYNYESLRVELNKTNGRIKQRIIPDKLKPIFKKLDRENKGNYLFKPKPLSHSKNAYIQTCSVRWYLTKLRRELNLNDKYYKSFNRISAHTFRHYFLRKFYEHSGNDILLTQKVIGHTRIETTAKYILPKDREQEVINCF